MYKCNIGKLETAVKTTKLVTNTTALMDNGDIRLYVIQDLEYKDTCLRNG